MLLYNNHQFVQFTLDEILGDRTGALLWIAGFYAIVPDRLEAHGVDCNSTKVYRLHIVA